jgi:hypothetical protein
MCSAALLAFDVLSYAYRRIGVNVDWMAVILLAALIAALAQVEESWGVDAAGETGPGCGTGPDSPVLAAAYRLAEIPGVSVWLAIVIIAEIGLNKLPCWLRTMVPPAVGAAVSERGSLRASPPLRRPLSWHGEPSPQPSNQLAVISSA